MRDTSHGPAFSVRDWALTAMAAMDAATSTNHSAYHRLSKVGAHACQNGTCGVLNEAIRQAQLAGIWHDDVPGRGVRKPRAPKRQKMPSRSDRWTTAASEAVAALTTLQEVQQEYSDWKDNLPENLAQSALGEKLETVCDLDIDGALDTANEAEGADLPLGFGRD